jgi:hypothetical protein
LAEKNKIGKKQLVRKAMTTKDNLTIYYTADNSDIIFAEFPANHKIDIVKAKEMVNHRLELAQNKKHFVIVDISNVRQVTKEAKEFLQHTETGLKDILGAAFIATNPVSALIANIFIKTPTGFDAKFFSNRSDAFNWIIAQRKKIVNNTIE